ncbi:hypothetical protein NMG60_11017190 [Bertholletia excelsa]
MGLTTPWSWSKAPGVVGSTVAVTKSDGCRWIPTQSFNLSSPIWPYTFPCVPITSCVVYAKKRNSPSDSVLKPTIVDEVSMDDEDDLLFEDFQDGELVDEDNDFEDELLAEDTEPCVGDGEGGGGISLAGTWWDREALAIAEDVCQLFDGDLGIYAFKTLANSTIRVRIENLLNKSVSPSMDDIEIFSLAYQKRLDEAELSRSVPENISLEVSSPGVERIVRIPQELDRFKERPMYVKYISGVAATGSSTENDGVFKLISFDLETSCCTWCLADVRVNREKAGKGRPLSKKQKEWRLNTPLDSILLVRLYSEI